MTTPCPYAGWRLYFPHTTFPEEGAEEYSSLCKLIDTAIVHFCTLAKLPFFELIEESGFTVSYEDLLQGMERDVDLADLLYNLPEYTLNCLGVALFEVVFVRKAPSDIELEPDMVFPKIYVRLQGYQPIIPIRRLKSKYIGKMITITGTVIRASTIRPIVIAMDFVCSRCSTHVECAFEDGKYEVPVKCPTTNCKSTNFAPVRSLARTRDWQSIRVQEQLIGEQNEAGRVPRAVECELTSDLVDVAVPGELVTVSGVVKVESVEPERRKGKVTDKGMFKIYLDASFVSNSKRKEEGDVKLDQKQLYFIRQMAQEPNLFSLLVNSICPGIFGHELVKAGLTLTLFGGCPKYADDRRTIPIRGDPHMLVVGDPGLGKSQMLQALHAAAPRGVYVCGSYTSSTGLTVTLVREKGTGDYALEAGALVLADQGICCIDEFDKMSKQHSALLEGMEQQSISIAKAGIVSTLPARTSVVAAANPIGGHYNPTKTIAENLSMSTPLLSRFDLIFILLDTPDEEHDRMLSEHVMDIHSGTVHSKRRTGSGSSWQGGSQVVEGAEAREDQPLSERLKVDCRTFDAVPAPLLRSYVSYARQYVKPRLSPKAGRILQGFYLELRNTHRNLDSTPLTTRQLESLIRLSEARAKLELRETVTEEDALDVVDIMKASLFSGTQDEYGMMDFREQGTAMGGMGSAASMSQAKQVKMFITAIKREAQQTLNNQFSKDDLWKISDRLGITGSLDDLIAKLNLAGYLLNRGHGMYELYN